MEVWTRRVCRKARAVSNMYQPRATPGPGAYNTDANRKKIPAITIRGRTRSSSSAHDAPSPASYYPNYHYLHKGPSPMMTSRPTLKPHQIFSGPGPGHYNVSSAFTRTNRRKGATIKSRNTPQDTFQTPGPGRYMLDAYADMQAKAKRRGFTMTARGHKDKSRFPGPGPGSYNIPSTFEKTNRAATIKSRAALTARLSSHLDTPGPGAYNVDKSHIDASRKKAPQFSMGIRRGVGESAVSPLKQKTGRRKKKFGRRKNMRGYQTQRQGYGFGNYQPMNMYSPAGYYDQNYNYVDNNNYNPYAQQQPTYHQGIPYHHQYEEQGNDPFAE